MSSETQFENSSDDHTLFRWFLTWRYDILTPLITINGFSELMLKDLNGALDKPLTDDEKRKFMGIIVNRSKSIRRALDFLSLYVRCREGVFFEGMLWKKESIEKILEDIAKELQAEEIVSKVVLSGKDDIPSIRTSAAELSSALSFLLLFTYMPGDREREISVELKKSDSDFVSIEINTNSYDQYSNASYLEELIKQPNHILLSKMIIELLDGKFEAFLQDKVLMYRLLLPIWLLPESMDEVIQVNIEERSVELYLGQEFEVVHKLKQKRTLPIPTLSVVDFDHNIIRITSSNGGGEDLETMTFAGIRAGSTVLKIKQSLSNDKDPIYYNMHITVKPQTPSIE